MFFIAVEAVLHSLNASICHWLFFARFASDFVKFMAIREADRPDSVAIKDSEIIRFHQGRTGTHILRDSVIC